MFRWGTLRGRLAALLGIRDYSPSNRTLTNSTSAVTTTTLAGSLNTHVMGFSTSYLTIPSSTDFDINAANWTMELRLYRTASTTWQQLLSRHAGATHDWQWLATPNAYSVNNVGFGPRLCTGIVQGSGTLTLNTWHHVAVVRSAGVMKMYVDGLLVGSDSSTPPASTNINLTLGASLNTDFFKGYMEEVAFWSIPKYTGNFTPPTTLIGRYSYGLKLLVNASYTGSDLPGAHIRDFSLSARSITNNSVTISSQAGSLNTNVMEFTTSYITVPTSSDFDISAATWTIEARVYRTTSTGYQHILSRHAGATYDWQLFGNTGADNATFGPRLCTGILQNTNTLTTNAWHHIAIVRSEGTITMYVDGLSVGTDISTPPASQNVDVTVGASLGTEFFKGKMEEVAFWSTARWTSNFTPPSSLIDSSDANLKLLLNAA